MAHTWEAVPVLALVNTTATVVMTTTVSILSFKAQQKEALLTMITLYNENNFFLHYRCAATLPTVSHLPSLLNSHVYSKTKGVGWGGAKDKLLSFNLYGLLLCFSLLPKHRRSSHRYKSLYGETFLKQQLSKSHLIDFFKYCISLCFQDQPSCRYNCGMHLGSCSCRSSCQYNGDCCYDYYGKWQVLQINVVNRLCSHLLQEQTVCQIPV